MVVRMNTYVISLDTFSYVSVCGSQDTVKSIIASLKKFYRLSKEDYEEFTDTIRVNKEYWIDCCSEYNDGISEW